jgi:transcriptional regulator GlxA family with amidase domain
MNDMSGHMAFKPPIPNRTFALVLLPGFSLLSLAGVTDTLKCANAVLGSEHYRWSLHAIDGPCVGSSSGLDVNVPGTPDSMEAGSNVILIGGRNTQNRESVTLRSWLRRTAVKSPLLGGIFTGSRLLAEAGLLDGYTAAIHWEMAAGFREAYPGIDVTGTLFEIDRNRLTCAGEHAVADMMLNIIANLSGKPVASTVAARLLHIRMRSPAEPQVPDQGNCPDGGESRRGARHRVHSGHVRLFPQAHGTHLQGKRRLRAHHVLPQPQAGAGKESPSGNRHVLH